MDPMSSIPTFVHDDVIVGQVGDGSHRNGKVLHERTVQASWWAQGMRKMTLRQNGDVLLQTQ